MVKVKRGKLIKAPIYGIGNRIFGYEYWEVIPKSKLPKDLKYQGVSGHSYFSSFTHYYSKSKKKTYLKTYYGNKFVKLVKKVRFKKGR